MKSFQRIAVRDMDQGMFIRHIICLITGGVILLAIATIFSGYLALSSTMRETFQQGRQVQRALSIVGEEYSLKNGSNIVLAKNSDGTLEGQLQQEALELAGASGIITLTGYDISTMQATRFTLDTGWFLVDYDAMRNPVWIVTCEAFPALVKTY